MHALYRTAHPFYQYFKILKLESQHIEADILKACSSNTTYTGGFHYATIYSG